MNVAVMCEFSGVVRRAFRAHGHDAWSFDLLPAEDGSRYHRQGDCLQFALDPRWDLIIAHPPCRYLSVSGAHLFAKRTADQDAAIWFFLQFTKLPCARIAIENPIGIMSTRYRKPDQIIQPWQYGHPESKRTCLWLKGLPRLQPTNVLPPRGDDPNRGWDNQTPSGQNRLGPSPDRWKLRSRTYPGIADAMAEQWGTSEGTYEDQLQLAL